MDRALLDELARRCRGSLLRDEPLWRHTSWQVGGPAAALLRPANHVDLVKAVRLLDAAGCPWLVLGGGSNLLVRDGGFPGVVLDLHAFNAVRIGADGLVEAEAGARLNSLIKQLVTAGLGGLEELAGIPGTVGGALVMNAGAGSQEFGRAVDEVEILSGETFDWRPAAALAFGYRHSELNPGEIVTAVRLRLANDDPELLQATYAERMNHRRQAHAVGGPSAGSVFKNPPGKRAWELIAGCGWQGRGIGGARASERHANFIINTGGAMAADIESLIEAIRADVLRQTGVLLETEVKIVGVPAAARPASEGA
ncbi:MAG: UDP-N-acetylmuramate dehydrogenase [Desulfuromonas sp.]|nr:UDP-N-acetylmuramate dehydrogenase [Desulfuromonas sp.]